MTKREVKNYAARIDGAEYEKAKELADEEGVSFNSYLNSALTSYSTSRSMTRSASLAGTDSLAGMNVIASSAVPQNYVFVVPEGSLSDVIDKLSKGDHDVEEEQEDPEAG